MIISVLGNSHKIEVFGRVCTPDGVDDIVSQLKVKLKSAKNTRVEIRNVTLKAVPAKILVLEGN